MSFNTNDAQEMLISRLDDYIYKSGRGELARSNFLTPAEISYLKIKIREKRLGENAFFFGGYENAERKMLYILPSYIDGEGDPINLARLYLPEEFEGSLRAIHVRGSGYRALSHRDYLGSLLALGVERDTLGDIVVLSDYECVIFCTEGIFNFLLGNIDRIASDKVEVSEFTLPDSFAAEVCTKPISDTVASARLDCVVAAITGLSREKAQALIRSGLCELDYIVEQRCDREVLPPCVISARGYGKYRIVSLEGKTKKGRIRLLAEKYI